MISFQNIDKIYPPEVVALKDVSFDVDQGEFVSLVGKSGAGKTTLLKLLLVDEKPTKGKIIFEGQNIHEIKESHLPDFRREIGVIFQDYKLLPLKTVGENIAYVMEVIGAKDEDIKRDVREVLDIVDLSDKIDNFPAQLSGGEKQRVAIARAFIHRPRVIIADEPTGNLDPYHTADIMRILDNINRLGSTVILATHNKDVINKLRKRVVTLEHGKIVRDEEKGRFII